MDEIDFGPQRESRLPARCRRALTAAGAAGIVAAAAVALLMHQGARVDQVASPPLPARSSPAPPVCPPAHATKPNLASIPAGMRPGAARIAAAAEYSGACDR